MSKEHKISKKRRPNMDTAIFINESNKLHGDGIYDYSKTIFKSQRSKIIIICMHHGEFLQTPECHLRGHGCPACGNLKTISYTLDDKQTFIDKANQKHNTFYNYDLVEYVNSLTNVKIICPIHGVFLQIPGSHLGGRGCYNCGRNKIVAEKRYTHDEILLEFEKIHNHYYDYSKMLYINTITPITIGCPVHGDFAQIPKIHLKGAGCSKCTKVISKPEATWLDSLDIPERQKIIKINNQIFKVDGFDPTTNTIYEFYGDYWHGNPQIYNPNDYNSISGQTFGNLYIKTINRESKLKQAGFKIVSMWEYDFKRGY